jgi:hypothetical protein
MLEPLPTWKQTFATLPFVSTPVWAQNIANWAGQRSTMKLQWAGLGGPIFFTFNQGVFQSQLMSLRPTSERNQAAMAVASAWETAMNASILMVTPGIFVGGPTPPTLFSAVAGMIDVPSIMRGKMALYQTLVSAPPVDSAFTSVFPHAVYQAFMSLTVSLMGMNSVPIPGPLAAPMVPAC